ncbi:MAG: STAS domain-containing protein [Zoogloeaceae bacterium]|nr:STAS domain-containing protein [Zoogloeaceae bacterium]
MIRVSGNTIEVSGEMNATTAAGLLAAGRPGAGDWMVDLAGVTHADSSAVAVLLDWLRASRRAGGRLSFRGVPSGVVSLARLYGVDEFLPLEPAAAP